MKISKESAHYLIIGLMIGLAFVMAFNVYEFGKVKSIQSNIQIGTSQAVYSQGPVGTSTLDSIDTSIKDIGVDIFPKGIPQIYGKELGVSFDEVSAQDPSKADATIKKLGKLDQEIAISEIDKTRYIFILDKLENGISCEYCCGAPSIIFEDGNPACGCAHSFAMRGLTKYLIKNHGEEYTDEEIFNEISKWKILFFPGKMIVKADALAKNGIEVNSINLASNRYRGIQNEGRN